MRLPSLQEFWYELRRIAERFPFTLLSAVVGTATAMVIMQHEQHAAVWLYNTGAVGFLGISWFFSLQLFAEQRQWSFRRSLAVKMCGLALLICYYAILPEDIFNAPSMHVLRYLLIVLALHFFASLAPFSERGYRDAFWEFNKTLFLRLATAALYSGVLYTGLCIAILAIDQLFTVHIKPERYMQLWWFLAGVFNTCFFLSGVPHTNDIQTADVHYPKGLKVFAQYIMVPLVAVYLCILYVYMGKIIVQWDWPKGWVGYLVLGFSITGIFSLLLLHPIKDRQENRWMAVVWKWFYAVVLPLVVLLLLAVWRRTSEYSLTEKRYFMIVLGVWLALVALYFLVSKKKSIKMIPASLCIIALFVSFGPWGAFSFSRRCQMQRLEEVLVRNQLLVHGKVQKAQRDVSFADAKTICSITRYLFETHGTETLEPWFDAAIDTLKGARQYRSYYQRNEQAERVAALLGIPYVGAWQTEDTHTQSRTYQFHGDSITVLPLKNYQYYIRNITLSQSSRTASVMLDGKPWRIQLMADSAQIVLTSPASNSSMMDLKERLSMFCTRSPKEYTGNQAPQEQMLIAAEHGTIQWKLLIQSVNVVVYPKQKVISSITADIALATGDR